MTARAKPVPATPREDHRHRLEKLRDQLAGAIETADTNMLPQLAGQYRATLEALAKLDAASPTSGIQDDLRKRREQRRMRQRPAANGGGR